MKDAGFSSLEEAVDRPTAGSRPVTNSPEDYPLPESWRSFEESSPQPPTEAAEPRTWLNAKVLVSALALLALMQAAFIAGRLTAPVAAPIPPAAIPVTISSTAGGDIVTVDGRQVGVTPYHLAVDGSMKEIQLASPPQPQVPQPVVTSVPPAPVDALVSSRPRSGGLRLTSPIEIQVLEGERVLGSSVDGTIVTTAGMHQLDFLNSALGYREHRNVEFKAGQVTTLRITPPNGRLNINAVPWAEVWIDGKEAGETPLANVSVTAGEHEILFRHPELRERRETALVKTGAVTRLSVTMAQ